jgi:hypothetical protein
MTKKEQLDNIIYDLRMKGKADFEADDKSFSIDSLGHKKGYCIEGLETLIFTPDIAATRKEIAKLGKNLLWM